jgi:hypothetical protein
MQSHDLPGEPPHEPRGRRSRRSVLTAAGAALAALGTRALGTARPAAAATGVYGKYRGTVSANVDALLVGRVEVLVPSVLGETPVWAMPSVPYAGTGVGLFLIPPVGAQVWVEFEAGDTNSPIWAGCFWGPGEVPPPAGSPDVKVLRTQRGSIVLDDGDAASLALSDDAVQIAGSAGFSRSGRSTVLAGYSSRTVLRVPLTAASSVLVTLQQGAPDISLAGVTTDPAHDSFTVFLNQTARANVKFAWLAID